MDERFIVSVCDAEHLLLPDNREAFAARLALIEQAQRRVCVQTYLLHDDETGRLFLSALCAAADRGVQIQLLLDDIDVFQREDLLATLSAHPNFDLRLFNPFAGRRFPRLSRFFSLLLDHGHLGRRMHNKVMIVDEKTLIVGGRNIGNAYFDAPAGVNFFDLDVMTRGAVVAQAVASFTAFWQHPSAVPIAQLHPGSQAKAFIQKQRQRLQRWLSQRHPDPVQWQTTVHQFQQRWQNSHAWLPAQSEFVADHPDKICAPQRSRRQQSPSARLFQLLRATSSEAILVSPYFVPRRRGVKLLRQLRQNGVAISVLTNSLAATDVPLVHGGYERYRRALLRAGIALFELKPVTNVHTSWRSLRVSHASLHAKTYVFDRRHVFVGSLNLDPRSLSINTECGLIINCTALADHIAQLFGQATQLNYSFHVQLQHHRLRWQSHDTLYHDEPFTTWSRRILARLARWLPIEAQL